MSQSIWLINVFGNPCAPSSFNPDNSLAALAGSLKAGGYKPLILDYQTLSYCSELMPSEFGSEAEEIISTIRSQDSKRIDAEAIEKFDKKIGRYQLSVVDKWIGDLVFQAKKEAPLFIGLKIYSGEGNYLSNYFATELKKQLDVPLVGGGPVIRVMGKKYLELYPSFDFLLNGEADRSILEFANFLNGKGKKENVKGLVYLDRKGCVQQNDLDVITDLNDLPDPCYDEEVYPALYQEGEKALIFQIDESRGCPNICSFCVHPQINGRRVRTMSPERIFRQIQHLNQKFGAMAFRFCGSNTPQRFLLKLADLINKSGINIRYSCYASVNMTKIEELDRLILSGLCGVFIGAESIEQDILSNVFNKRGQSANKIKTLITHCLDRGLFTVSSWIYPMPFWSQEMRGRIKDFILDCYGGRSAEEGSVVVIPSVLTPSSEWFSNYKKYGFEVEDEDRFYRAYAGLKINMFKPRRLLGQLGFTLHGKNFLELTEECDLLERELYEHGIPLNNTDDWMLMGKLSGLPMDEFKAVSEKYLTRGDYESLRSIICQINKNSKEKNWSQFTPATKVKREKPLVA